MIILNEFELFPLVFLLEISLNIRSENWFWWYHQWLLHIIVMNQGSTCATYVASYTVGVRYILSFQTGFVSVNYFVELNRLSVPKIHVYDGSRNTCCECDHTYMFIHRTHTWVRALETKCHISLLLWRKVAAVTWTLFLQCIRILQTNNIHTSFQTSVCHALFVMSRCHRPVARACILNSVIQLELWI